MATIGRISGQMLKDNLTRDGVDLAIETDLVYFDVNNKRVGVKTTSPQYDLDVNGTTRTTNLEVSNTAHVGGVTISGNTIQSDSSVLALQPSGINSVVYNARAVIGTGLELEGNVIRTTATNTDIELQPNGTGAVNIYGNSTVYGNLHTTGNITADGNIQLGDQNTDAITFTADIASNLIPYNNDAFQLGSSSKRWRDLWVSNINAGTISGDVILANGVNIATTQGNIIYVATNGDDGNAGQHQNDPVASVGRALNLATAGDTVYIYPGTYEETIPLVVPPGVTVKGSGIKSVTIKPDSNTGEDIFHVDGEVTIEDLTVSGFNFNAGANKGYAFRFKPSAVVTSRSPYIRNVSVITTGSVTSGTDPRGFAAGDAGKGALVDGSAVGALSKEAAMLFHSVTMITPGVDAITATNGARVEWLNSFSYFANRGIYAYTGSTGLAGDGKTRIKIATRTGTFAVGNTLSYYDTDGTTVLASGTIESIDGDFFNIDGKVLGFETLTDRATKTVYAIGDAKLSTVQKKFGTASLILDGVGDYVRIDSQPDFIYAGDFTAEGWFYPTDVTGPRYLFAFGTEATDRYVFFIDSGVLKGNLYGSAVTTFGGTISTNVWTHIAFSRSGSTIRAFVNGTLLGTTHTYSGNVGNGPFKLGVDASAGTPYVGYIDEVRITSGLARYTATFTAPTSAFTSDTDTILLLHFNGANNSTTIVDDGVTTQDIRTSAGGTAKQIDVADYTDFGCEMRAIASANVYGNYGAYADGVGNILYLVSQNFAYIGTGKDSSNDPSAVIQANEVYTANGAKIYYSSVDHQGDFRVGDLFYVDQKNGNVTFSAETFNINSLTGVTFTDGTDSTIIDATKIETGNIRISGNDIISITGNIGITPASGQLNITGTTNITGNNNVTGNLSVTGNTTIGDANTDTLTINSKVIGDLVPNTTGVYNLGSSSLNWENMYGTKVVIDDLEITGNVIRTTTSNANLELNANGTGSIIIDSLKFTTATISTVNTNTDINISPTGTGFVNVNSALVTTGAATINGVLTANSNVVLGSSSANTLTVNSRIIGDVVPTTTATYTLGSSTLKWGNLFAGNAFVDDIQINDNYITTTASNANLELRANGTGSIRIDQLDIKTNTISSNTLNGNINLTANGTGSVVVTSPLTVQGALTVNASTTFAGSVTLGDTSADVINVIGQITGNLVPTATATYDIGSNGLRWQNIYAGNVYVDDLLLSDNVIATTISNSNLELRGNGTGSVRIDQLDFKNNIVSANTANTDIQLQSTGTGSIRLNSNTDITGNLNVTGNITLGGNIQIGDQTSDTISFVGSVNSSIIPIVSASYDLGSNAQRWRTLYSGNIYVDDILLTDNYISTTVSNSNLELRGNGTGSVRIDQLDVKNNSITANTANTDINVSPTGTGSVKLNSNTDVTGNLNVSSNLVVNGNTTLGDASTDTISIIGSLTGNIIPNATATYSIGSNTLRWQNIYAGNVYVDDILITDNYIATTISNSNLELRGNGTGSVRIDQLDIKNNIVSANTANTDINISPTGTGSVKLNSSTDVTGNLNVSSNLVVNGNTTLGDSNVDTINVIGSLTGNIVPNATATYDIGSNGLRWQNIYAGNVYVDDILITDNYIATTASNANLELRGNGTGSVRVDQLDIKNNLISTNVAATDLRIQATGAIKLLSNTDVTGSITASGNLVINGNTTLGDANTDTVNVVGRFISNLTPSTTLTRDLGTASLQWRTVYTGLNIVDQIEINDNYIKTTTTNGNLELRPNGTGSIRIDSLDIRSNIISANTTNTDIRIQPSGTGIVRLQASTSVTGDVTASGNLVINGNTTLGDTTADTINPIGRFINNLIPNTTTTYELGTSGLVWRNVYAGAVYVDDILINDNYVTTTVSNANLELRGNGTGSVRIDSIDIKGSTFTANTANTDISIQPTGTGIVRLLKDTDITGNLTVNGNISLTGNITVGDAGTDTININGTLSNNLVPTTTATYDLGSNSLRWRTLYAGRIIVDDIEINDNYITTTTSNANLELRANGTGAIVLEDLTVNQTTISSVNNNQDITLTPTGTGVVRFNTTQAVVLPVGTEAQRPATPSAGMIRFNSSQNTYEGYQGSYWVQLGGISSVNRKTRITPENTIGANDNVIRFYTDDVLSASLSSTALSVNALVVDDLRINNNTISTITTNADLEFAPNGTGSVVIDNLKITNNTITNTLSNGVTQFVSTGLGYYKIAGTNGVVIPTGGSLQRPAVVAVGMIRYNTDLGLTEIWDGAQWSSVAGASSGINASQAEDIAIGIALSFG